MPGSGKYIRWFTDASAGDVRVVGGKNASLSEMTRALTGEGISVPLGFATTSDAFRAFLDANGLEERIRERLDERSRDNASLEQTGTAIRRLFSRAAFPTEVAEAIVEAYRALSDDYGMRVADVAVRSSATAEDLPSASFAGQHESFLNVRGEAALLDACRKCYASLFTNRAIVYREEQGFDHLRVALSIGIQKMVRSDKAGAGVMFSIDTETGFPDVVIMDAAWGLGEAVVQGSVTPDEYTVFKPLLDDPRYRPIIDKVKGDKGRKIVYATGSGRSTKIQKTTKRERSSFVLADEEILQLARWARTIESHYGRPMDIEWAKDGRSGQLFIVQARPETVQSRKEGSTLRRYTLRGQGEPIVTGLSIGDAIASGKARIIRRAESAVQLRRGEVLVTEMTDPDWVPIMKRASAIVTERGGRTCHAAIVGRELGIPVVVGAENAMKEISSGQEVTVSCAEGDEGHVYDGLLQFSVEEERVADAPETKTEIMVNLANPSAALRWWRLPAHGVGLARMEFIINNAIRVHPMALVHFSQLSDKAARRRIAELTEGYADRSEYFVDRLGHGIARIAASRYPYPVLVRLSDFKTNEYASLIGGQQFEPPEENPMLGFRGASRYYSDKYREGFALECRAIKRAREEIGLTNVMVMVPFCRTPDEADLVLEEMRRNGLSRGEDGLKVYVMCEIPSNVVLASEFAKRFDGFSIGSNDLTQLVLGVDRDSGELAHLFDERNAAVKKMIVSVIDAAHEAGCTVGICGQGPSDYPEFAEFLVEAGIDSISLNPDSVLAVTGRVAEAEAKARRDGSKRSVESTA